MTNVTAQKTSAGTKPSTHFDYSHFNTSSVKNARANRVKDENQAQSVLGGHRTETHYINTKDIYIDDDFQRDLNERRGKLNKVIREFDPDKMEAIKIAEINGIFYCYDGQLTLEAAKVIAGGDLDIRCEVKYGLTIKEMADLFTSQGKNNTKVSMSDKIRVSVNAGDPDAILFKSIIEQNGFSTDRSAYRKPGLIYVKAAKNLWDEFQYCTHEQFERILMIMREAFDGDEYQTHNGIISGLGLFIRKYDGRFAYTDLIKSLKRDGALRILKDARNNERTESRAARRYARAILASYNWRRKSKKLPDEL